MNFHDLLEIMTLESESSGQALEWFTRLADNTPYADWTIADLDETANLVWETYKEDRGWVEK